MRRTAAVHAPHSIASTYFLRNNFARVCFERREETRILCLICDLTLVLAVHCLVTDFAALVTPEFERFIVGFAFPGLAFRGLVLPGWLFLLNVFAAISAFCTPLFSLFFRASFSSAIFMRNASGVGRRRVIRSRTGSSRNLPVDCTVA